MSWNSVLGLISSVALICPVILILYYRLATYSTFPALLIYYTSVFIYNMLTEGYLVVPPAIVKYWGLANNFLDAPLMFAFLIYFSPSAVFTKRLKLLIGVFAAFEIIVIAFTGFNTKAVTIILGPGIILTIGFFLYFFIRHTKAAITNSKAFGKAMMAAALLFAYGCYGIIYTLYYVFKTPFVEDTFLVYFLVVTISSFLITTGIFIEEKRIRKLNELRLTRRELSDVYADEKKTAPVKRTVMLDFDREQWN